MEVAASAGCCRTPATEHKIESTNSMPATICIIGKRFGRLIVIEEAPPKRDSEGDLRRRSICKCDCGQVVEILNASLRVGLTQSCGCLQKEMTMKSAVHHGHARDSGPSSTYRSWTHMNRRCADPNSKCWMSYGGRGIKVCDRWVKFENFLADMGERPIGKSLDRYPDNNGNYEPGNCRWASRKEQSRNMRSNRIATVNGITGCISELCELTGIPASVVFSRIHKGWSDADALTKPCRQARPSLT
jgi:hypothetical protein